MSSKKLEKKRQKNKIRVMSDENDDDQDGRELFVAQPAEDIPRNALTEKLIRGL